MAERSFVEEVKKLRLAGGEVFRASAEPSRKATTIYGAKRVGTAGRC